jgi:hypothetical protein
LGERLFVYIISVDFAQFEPDLGLPLLNRLEWLHNLRLLGPVASVGAIAPAHDDGPQLTSLAQNIAGSARAPLDLGAKGFEAKAGIVM